MKFFFVMMLLMTTAQAQQLWEHKDEKCLQTKLTVDDAKNNLKQKYGNDCDYLKDATRIVIGNFFKCGKDKMHSYFRTKEACEMFFSDEKKELEKFAPQGEKDPKRWVKTFGNCMETATTGQINKLGPQWMNSFCYCVAEKTVSTPNSKILNDCSKRLGAN